MAFNFSNFDKKAQKALDHVRQDIGKLRTGRATAQLLDPVVVEAYGSQMKIEELANINAPDATLLVVKPWDENVIEDIEKAIAKADLNLNPVVDGDIIRIAVPPLTEEKRKRMVKALQEKVESGRVMLRNVRTAAKQAIEEQKGDDGISEDDIERDLATLDDKFQQYASKLDQMEANKEEELMTV